MTDPSTLSHEEIARAVAVEVMGWVPSRRNTGLWATTGNPDEISVHALSISEWNPAGSIRHAWQVVEKMKERGFFADVRIGQNVVHCEFADYDGDIAFSGGAYAKALTAPLAICLAALRAVRGGVR